MKKTLYLFLTIFLGNTVNAMEQSNSPLMKLPNEMLIKILSFTDFIDKEKFNDPKNVTDLDESVKLKNLKLVCKNFNTAGTALINISLKNLESYNSDNQFSNVNQELSLKKNYLLKKRNLIFPEIKEILIEVFPFVNELAFMDDDSKSVKESGDQIIRLFLDNSSYYCGLNKTNMEKIWGPLCENNLFTNLNNIKNRKHGQTPLHLASLYDYPEVVKLLLENGAKVDIQDYCGDTPLHGASFSGHTEVVKLLLENGAPIDIQDNFGDTPLHLASRKGHLEVVKLLLEKRAQIDIKNKNGWTPLRLASFKGKLKAVKLLEEAKKRKKVTQDQYNAIKVLTSNKTGNELWQCNYMQAPSIDQPREKSIIDTNIDTDPDRDISNEEKQENFSTHEKPKSSILHNYNPFKWKYAFGLPLLSIGYWAYKHFITKCH